MEQLNQYLLDQKELTFEDWYKLVYPKRVEKARAEKEWNKLSEKDKCLATIDPPERLKRHAQWQDKQMIPSPRRYLLRKLWTDEIITARTKEDIQRDNEDGSIQARFWKLLMQADGRIEGRYGATIPYTWKTSLKTLTGQEAARIIEYLTHDTDPSIPTVRKINQIRNIGRSFETSQKLIGNPSKPETVDRSIKEIKRILGL